MVEHGKAPGVSEGDEVRLAGVEVDKERLGTCAQLPDAREVVYAPSQVGIQEGCPHEEGSAIAPAFKVGEEAVDGVRVGGKQVDGVHLGVGLAPILDALDDWNDGSRVSVGCKTMGEELGGTDWRCCC